jgi:hypothetical protein
MTSSILDEIAALPDPTPEPEIDWGQTVLDNVPEEPVKRRRGRPRKPREIDPATGKEVDPPKRTYTPRASKLKDELLDPYVEFASDLAVVAPTVAGVLIVRAEATVNGMVDLAAGHPKVLNALKNAGKVGKGAALIETLMLVVAAAAIDLGRIDPSLSLLDHLGHSEVAKDEKGNIVRDENGKITKNRTTLRDIYEMTHTDSEIEKAQQNGPPPPPDLSGLTAETGTAPVHTVPMNNKWVEHGR